MPTTILTGSARITNAALMAKIAELEARLEGEQSPAKAKAEMPAFRTKAQRAAGKGHACRAGCSRKDLRTYKRAGSHDLETGHIAR
jgi:hypothetical protein